jgi:hypothetical protein
MDMHAEAAKLPGRPIEEVLPGKPARSSAHITH